MVFFVAAKGPKAKGEHDRVEAILDNAAILFRPVAGGRAILGEGAGRLWCVERWASLSFAGLITKKESPRGR